MAYSCVRVHFEIGHESSVRNKRTPKGFTHDWELFVRGADNADIHHFVDKVVFHLHDSFPNPIRTFEKPPYVLKESGYAGFNIPIEIYLKNKEEPRIILFTYDLTLQRDGPRLTKVIKEKTDFTNPSEDFRRKLIRGGGIGIGTDGNITSLEKSHNHSGSNSQIDDSKSSPHSSKPKITNNNPEVKKHKSKESLKSEDVRVNNTFTALFGPPIKTSKQSPNPKPLKTPAATESKSSSHSHEKQVKELSKASKHSSHKDKEKDRDSNKKEKDSEKVSSKDKDKGKEKEKDAHKEKDKSKEKNSRKQSISPLPSSKEIHKEENIRKATPEENNKEKDKNLCKSESGKSEKKHKEKKSRDEKEKRREEKHKNHSKKDAKETYKDKFVEKSDKKIEAIKEGKESKDKHKTVEKEEKKIKTEKEKDRSYELEKQKHKHKKKDKHKKDEEKERSKKKDSEKLEIQKPKLVNKSPPPIIREKSPSPDRKKVSVNPLNMLFQELSDKDSDSDFSGSMEDDMKIEPIVEAIVPPPPPPPPSKLKIDEKLPEVKEEKSKKKGKKSKDEVRETKKRKRKNKDKEEPGEKILKVEPKDDKADRSSVKREERSLSPETLFTEDYVTQLKDLQRKIMTLQDNADLQKVVQVISETGQFEITQRTFDFDLCTLDRSTVKRLQDMFVAAS